MENNKHSKERNEKITIYIYISVFINIKRIVVVDRSDNTVSLTTMVYK